MKDYSARTVPQLDQFRGCLVGQCLGDALGFQWKARHRKSVPPTSKDDMYPMAPQEFEKLLAPIDGLHLCDTAIHKQFRPRDVAAVVGCQKHYGLGDLIGRTK